MLIAAILLAVALFILGRRRPLLTIMLSAGILGLAATTTFIPVIFAPAVLVGFLVGNFTYQRQLKARNANEENDADNTDGDNT